MAINKAINHSPKTTAGLRNSIEYILNPDKTKPELCFINGFWNDDVELNWHTVSDAFKEEKSYWGKESGRQCVHNVISWHESENISPEDALDFAKEFFSKVYPEHQTLIAVHVDKEHVHVHAITNSVSFVDGSKIHQSKQDLKTQKDICNEMCRQRGYSIAEKGKHFDGSERSMGDAISWNMREYQPLKKASSFVRECAVCVLESLAACEDKETFISEMKERGWKTTWEEGRKHISFEDAEGHKVRDSKLKTTFNIDISKEAITYELTKRRPEIVEDDQREEIERSIGYSADTRRESKAARGKSEAARAIADADAHDADLRRSSEVVEQSLRSRKDAEREFEREKRKRESRESDERDEEITLERRGKN